MVDGPPGPCHLAFDPNQTAATLLPVIFMSFSVTYVSSLSMPSRVQRSGKGLQVLVIGPWGRGGILGGSVKRESRDLGVQPARGRDQGTGTPCHEGWVVPAGGASKSVHGCPHPL